MRKSLMRNNRDLRKKINSKKAVLTTMVIIALICSLIPVSSVLAADNNFKFSFMTISDVHQMTSSDNANLVSALSDSVANNCSAICFIGDSVNMGYLPYYDALVATMGKYAHPTAYYAFGNHEYRWLTPDWAANTDYNTALTRWESKLGMSNNYYDKWVSGYHFIFLGSDSIVPDSDAATLSTTQLNWLSTALANQAVSNKPIFVFMHQDFVDIQQSTELKAILNNYPQVILTTGHTHNDITASGNIDTTSYNFKWINDGSCGFNDQGLIFNVYGDRVEIKGRKLSTKTTIANWFINYGSTSNLTYYYIKNRWTGNMLNIENKTGTVEATTANSGWYSAQWSLETHEGYIRFKNRWTGEYMHEEGNLGYEQYGALGNPYWHSCDFSCVSNGSYLRLQNRWTDKFVNNEHKYGYAESTANLPTYYLSGDWTLIPAN